MVAIRLMGGLGNQMFQYSFGKAMEARGAEVYFDRSHVDGNNRPYALHHFRTQVPFAGTIPHPMVFEPTQRYSPHMLDFRQGTLIGYWQCEKYFSEIEQKLRDHFMPRNFGSLTSQKVAHEIIGSKERNAFIHVRRGDYVGLTHFHGMPGMDYYNEAISRLNSQTPNLKFFVFSDDPAWCRVHFPDFRLVDDTSPCEDLALMAGCRHAIIANSSFSWWGAWLGGNREDRVVIAPKRWFTTDQADGTDIPCEWWLRI